MNYRAYWRRLGSPGFLFWGVAKARYLLFVVCKKWARSNNGLFLRSFSLYSLRISVHSFTAQKLMSRQANNKHISLRVIIATGNTHWKHNLLLSFKHLLQAPVEVQWPANARLPLPNGNQDHAVTLERLDTAQHSTSWFIFEWKPALALLLAQTIGPN